MSLRDRLQEHKAVKAEVKSAEAAEAQAQEAAQLKSQYQGFLDKQSSLTSLQERAASANEQIASAKGNLKKERGNLRALHKESIDEDTQEALIPKPTELIRGEEYQEEEEIQQYGQAREAFRESAKGAKEVAEELKALGIENPAALLPGQLDAILEEQNAAAQQELEQFLLEHPEVDPERAAEVKERMVGEKVEYLDKKKHLLWNSEIGDAFRKKGVTSFTEGASAATESLLTSDRDIREYIEAARTLEGKGAEEISPLTREALARALAHRLFDAGDENNTLLRSFVRDNPDVIPDAENVPVAEVQAKAEQMLAESPEVTSAVEYMADLAKRLDTYEKIPQRLREMAERNETIDRRLGTDDKYFRESSIRRELQEIEDRKSHFEYRENSNSRELESLLEAAPRLLQLKQLPENILESNIKVAPGSFGAKISIDFETGVDNWPEKSRLRESINEATKEIPRLRNQMTRIAGMKDGLFGGPSKEKRSARADLFEDVKRLTSKEVGSEEEAEAALAQAQSRIAEDEATIEKLIGEEKTFKESIKPMEDIGAQLGEYRFEGTAREYLALLSEKLPQQLEAAEAEKEALRVEKEETEEKRRQLEQERAELQAEKSGLTNSMQSTKELEARLGQELYTKNLISYRRPVSP